MSRSLIVAAIYILTSLTYSLGQTITVKIQFNPIIHIEQKIPLSIGGGFEIGLSAKSSLQLIGSYRIDKQLSYGIDQGPKVYLDYRYYFNNEGHSNSGVYISPFIGYGHLQLAEGDLSTGELVSNKRKEILSGFLIGCQPFKKNRFSIDLFIGPEYQLRTDRALFQNGIITQTYSNRLWIRAGINTCFRLKK